MDKQNKFTTERLQKARNKYNLRIDSEQKCQFSKNELNILGTIVNGNSIKPDKQKLEETY